MSLMALRAACSIRSGVILLPGPGRFLSNIVIRQDGQTDPVAPRIFEERGMHKTTITASATMTIEGLKTVRPYLQREW